MATLRGDSTEPNVPAVKGDGVNLGVVGTAQDGWAILGESEKQVGVVGRCEDGWGVSGESKTQVGVRGVCHPGWGVAGESKAGLGVRGVCESGAGVLGDSKTADGVFGKSETGRGVVGVAKSAVGTEGNSTSGAGVYGRSETGEGVYGQSNSPTKAAIAAINLNSAGTGAAVYAKKAGNVGHAGFFEGNVDITGNLNVQGRSFQALIQTIQQLQQQVGALQQQVAAMASTRTGTGTASVTAMINQSGGFASGHVLKITGTGFQANEQVSLYIGYTVGTYTTYSNESAGANTAGGFTKEIGVSCPAATTNRPKWSVVATGLSSTRTASKYEVTCP